MTDQVGSGVPVGPSLGRRALVAGAAMALLASPPVLGRPARAAEARLVFSLWGGSFTEAMQKAFLDPFSKETGIEVVAASAPSLAKVRAQVQTGNTGWDLVVPLVGWDAVDGSQLWAPVDYDAISMPGAAPQLKRPFAVTFAAGVGGICWDSGRSGGRTQHPETWAEFWDAKAFPGRRGLRARAQETLEIALLSDGVPPDRIYPLDLDQAFRALDRIKPAVSNWIEATEQTVSLVQNNDCDFTYTYTYTSRVAPARAAGSTLGFSYKQDILQPVLISVVSNSPNKPAAMKLIDFIMRPDRQAAFAVLSSDVPVVPAALDLLAATTRAGLPKLDDPGNVLFDAEYWGRNVEAVERRFKEWLLT